MIVISYEDDGRERVTKTTNCADGMCGGCPRCGWRDEDHEETQAQSAKEDGVDIIITRTQAMPPCCANCRLASWREDGLCCHHPARISGEIDQDEQPPVHRFGFEQPQPGDIDWNSVCDLHEPGFPFGDREPSDLVAMRAAEESRRMSVFLETGQTTFV